MSNNLTLYLSKLGKEEQITSKINRRKEKIKIIVEINRDFESNRKDQ